MSVGCPVSPGRSHSTLCHPNRVPELRCCSGDCFNWRLLPWIQLPNSVHPKSHPTHTRLSPTSHLMVPLPSQWLLATDLPCHEERPRPDRSTAGEAEHLSRLGTGGLRCGRRTGTGTWMYQGLTRYKIHYNQLQYGNM